MSTDFPITSTEVLYDKIVCSRLLCTYPVHMWYVCQPHRGSSCWLR